MRSSTITPPVEPIFSPAAARQCVVGLLVGAHHGEVGDDLAVGGLYRAQVALAEERLQRGVEVGLDAEFAPRLLDRLHDVGVGHLRHGPRARVDQMGLDAAMRERRGHLHAERRRLDDDRHLDGVENLVPLHRLADVLDVVEALEVTARNPGVGVVESGRQHQTVPGDVLPGNVEHLAAEVDAGDLGLIADVDARLDVGLFGGQEKSLEIVDFLAVHVGNAARAVGDVLELGEHDDLVRRIGRLHPARRTESRRAATDDYDLARHASYPLRSPSG